MEFCTEEIKELLVDHKKIQPKVTEEKIELCEEQVKYLFFMSLENK